VAESVRREGHRLDAAGVFGPPCATNILRRR
jgi:hypothetical protein